MKFGWSLFFGNIQTNSVAMEASCDKSPATMIHNKTFITLCVTTKDSGIIANVSETFESAFFEKNQKDKSIINKLILDFLKNYKKTPSTIIKCSYYETLEEAIVRTPLDPRSSAYYILLSPFDKNEIEDLQQCTKKEMQGGFSLAFHEVIDLISLRRARAETENTLDENGFPIDLTSYRHSKNFHFDYGEALILLGKTEQEKLSPLKEPITPTQSQCSLL
jgi:hypothetical protein